MSTVLDRIKAYKLEEVAARKTAKPLAMIEAEASAALPTRPFAQNIRETHKQGRAALIAEIKKASPSKGLIRGDFDPPTLAHAYQAGGATCLSVLTDAPSFQGHDSYLAAARAACDLPVLRKDFLYDPYQVIEARALQADCILIIMASVSDAQAAELADTAKAWNMDVLVEVHNEEELERALPLSVKLLGINNRDLHSFETRLDTTRRLAPLVPADRMVVSESGLNTAEDLAAMEAIDVHTFLIGEALMRQDDVTAATKAILRKGAQE